MKGKSILFFGGSDWWVHAKRTESFLALHLAHQGNRVLYVNTIGIGIPSLSASSTIKRIIKKLSSLVRWVGRVEPGLWVLSPLVIPLWSKPFIRRFNTVFLRFQIAVASRLAGIHMPLAISAIPTSATVLQKLRYKAHVYFIKDHFTEYYEPMAWSSVDEHDKTLKELSQAIVCSSIGMYDMLKTEYPCVRWIPHGVAPEYLQYDSSAPEPEWLSAIPHPRIYYWGQLENTLNSELLTELAQQRPDWHFLFTGPKLLNYGELERLPNVHFLPSKPTSELIAAGLHCDVLTIPWREMPWTRYACPIKYREYLAVGKPVVSGPILEVERAYPGAAAIARTVPEWIAAIEHALVTNTPEADRQRRALVAGFDTQATMKMFDETLEAVLEGTTCAE